MGKYAQKRKESVEDSRNKSLTQSWTNFRLAGPCQGCLQNTSDVRYLWSGKFKEPFAEEGKITSEVEL